MAARKPDVAFRLSVEMMEEIARAALMKGRMILLVKTPEQAEKVSKRLRDAISVELRDNASLFTPARGRGPLLKAIGSNPSFVQLTHGGWVFIWPADDMSADEELGQPQFVYWPSEGGAYEKVPYNIWQAARGAGHIYRPVSIAPPKKKNPGRPTAWDRLMADEDE
jgi:hypothetical protein